MNEKKKTTKKSLTVIAVLLICAMTIGGTIAWLNSTSKLDNTFTVGHISPIDPDGEGPTPETKPTIPGEDKNPEAGKLNGNLYEPSWIKDSKLLPSAIIKKDPYVGVGAGSEKSYVYIYVDNTMKNNNHIYFTINDGWEAVSGATTTVPGENTHFTGGLFKYTLGLEGKTANTWTTTPVFSNVIVDTAAVAEDFQDKTSTAKVGSIKVQSFVHQYYEADGKTAINEETIVIPAAKKAFGISQ